MPTPLQVRRAIEREARAAERARVVADKAAKRAYSDQRADEVDDWNEQLGEQVEDLRTILDVTLGIDDYLDIESLKIVRSVPGFRPPDRVKPAPSPEVSAFVPKPPGFLSKLVPGSAKSHQRKVAEGTSQFEMALAAHLEGARKSEAHAEAQLRDAESRHLDLVAAIDEKVALQHAEIDSFASAFAVKDPAAVAHYFSLVLGRSSYPSSFPRVTRLAFVPESRQLVVEFDLPTIECVPARWHHLWRRGVLKLPAYRSRQSGSCLSAANSERPRGIVSNAKTRL